jgi:raffinose/stachyose/melibiose transport system permease protein
VTESISPLARARRRRFPLFVVPALAVYVVIVVVPVLGTLWISFNVWAGAGPMEFVGIENYLRMVRDPYFLTAFGNTMLILVGVGAGTFFFSYLLTMVLTDMAGKKFIRSVIFFPHLVPGLVLSFVWGFLWNSDGLVNSLLNAMGVSEPPAWLAESNVFGIIMLGLVWLNVGTYTTIFLAAAGRIPPSLYEAADIAGANFLQKFRYITFPLLRNISAVCAVLWTIAALNVFEFILAFAGASGQVPNPALWNLALYAYAESFAAGGTPRFGMTCACAVVILVLAGVLVSLIRRFGRDSEVEF